MISEWVWRPSPGMSCSWAHFLGYSAVRLELSVRGQVIEQAVLIAALIPYVKM